MTGKIGVKALIPGDEFVREGESRHHRSLFEPEDGTEGAGEEDSFDSCKGN